MREGGVNGQIGHRHKVETGCLVALNFNGEGGGGQPCSPYFNDLFTQGIIPSFIEGHTSVGFKSVGEVRGRGEW